MNRRLSPQNVVERRLLKELGGKPLKLPRDFSWQLLGLVTECCSGDCCSELLKSLRGITRNRDAKGYHGLAAVHGLQSIPAGYGPNETLKVASTLLLASTAKKNETIESVSREDRKRACLDSVRDLDLSLKCILEASDPVVSSSRQWLEALLGPIPDPTFIADCARHGPGSTVFTSSGHTSAYFKYSEWPYTVTPEARTLLTEVIRGDDRWRGVLESSFRQRYRLDPWNILNQEVFYRNILTDVPFNRITTVPKDGTKDRPIAIEPTGNVYLQLGIEGVIRKRLLDHGFDLSDQTVNKRLAQLGSRNSCVASCKLYPATLDLSSASDTISMEVCQLLLPDAWFRLLVSVRSPYGEFPDGTGWRYAKMSSMGNGTTFVLETILFLSIIMGVSRVHGHKSDRDFINVYGDDCVYPSYLDAPVRGYLTDAGFRVNAKKSFATGPVRESCGGDYFHGADVRPAFMPERFHTVSHVLSYRNHLNRWFRRHYGLASPKALDDFFLKYVEAWIGPESDDNFDSWWHFFGATGDSYCYQTRISELPGREFEFRKLMHTLRSCEGDTGHFTVRARDIGSLRVVKKHHFASFYSFNGVQQDYVPPDFIVPSI